MRLWRSLLRWLGRRRNDLYLFLFFNTRCIQWTSLVRVNGPRLEPSPHCNRGSDHGPPVRRPVSQQPLNHPDLHIALPMALEVTLGNANLLQLAEALSLKAEKVRSGCDLGGFRSGP